MRRRLDEELASLAALRPDHSLDNLERDVLGAVRNLDGESPSVRLWLPARALAFCLAVAVGVTAGVGISVGRPPLPTLLAPGAELAPSTLLRSVP